LGELRDRSFENQRYRASRLNLAVAAIVAIVAWNTVYLERAVASLSAPGKEIGTDVLSFLVIDLVFFFGEAVIFGGMYKDGIGLCMWRRVLYS
jgi:Tn3 transposase DDE domain